MSGNMLYHLKGSVAALYNYQGHTVTAMSYLAGNMQLTLHLQPPLAAAAAQQAAEAAAAAAAEAAATWQVHQVCLVSRNAPISTGLYY
jgi:hypothetical protein